MQTSSLNESVDAPSGTGDELSLFGGGLFYRWQVLSRLATPPKWHPSRRVTWSLAVSWLPLVILTAWLHREQLWQLLTDYEVYSRIVVAIPVLLIARFMMEGRFRVLALYLRQADLLDDAGQATIDRVIAALRKLRDSVVPELLIVVIVYVELVAVGRNRAITGPGWGISTSGGFSHLNAVGWYYLLVSLAIYQFLILFTFWKWLLWCFFLFKLSRTKLKLVATHADGHGGLGFLDVAPVAFSPVALALSAAIGGSWRNEIVHSSATLGSLWLPIVSLLVVIFMFELGPMCFFVPRLADLRSRAKLEYGMLEQRQATQFHDKWILQDRGRARQPPELSDVSTLAFAASYDRINRLIPFPVVKRELIWLALAVLVPMIPVVLAEIPLSAILKGLLGAVKAAPF